MIAWRSMAQQTAGMMSRFSVQYGFQKLKRMPR